LYGQWTTSPGQYIAEVRRWQAAIGGLAWSSIQDWMCEPVILAKTGLTVEEHQARTTANYFHLMDVAPDVPWIPVIQGFEYREYVAHIRAYRAAGVDLRDIPVVGLGSICRRQGTDLAAWMIRRFHDHGIKIHGFGFKMQGLRRCADVLASADSMAWSFRARRIGQPAMPGCTHRACNNCLRFALHWRGRVEDACRCR
jgi:hypothetical protein